MVKRLLTTAAIVVGALWWVPADAAIIDFGLNALGNVDEGVTHTFSNSGVSIFGKAEAGALHLYGKQLGGDENGLGTTGDASGQNEIETGHGFVQLDISGLVGKVTAATVDFSTNSVTNGEKFQVGAPTPQTLRPAPHCCFPAPARWSTSRWPMSGPTSISTSTRSAPTTAARCPTS